MACCNNTIEIKTGKSNGKEMFYAECKNCGKKHKAETRTEVEKYFNLGSQKKTEIKQEIEPIPTKPSDIIKWGNSNLPALLSQSAHFIDKPATKRMLEKNIRYVSNLTGKSWDKIWKTPEGQETILYALSEANYYACTLGVMGDIVPFGSTAEFIPAIECYKFALETGRNAPFKDIQINLIHENDITENYQKDGNFFIEIKRGIPRGEVVAVVVSGIRTDTEKRIGEIYDAYRLIEKAKAHSPSYRNYLIERDAFNRLKVEGKLKTDSDGRLYFEKSIPKADGGTWNKKIYESDISNPYDGADRPEMLRKSAGKSFFRPYMKTRNASAMADEWDNEPIESRDQAADHVLNRASEQFHDVPNRTGKTSDAEIVEEPIVQKQFDENDEL